MPLHGDGPIGALDAYLGYWLRFVAAHVTYALRRKVEEFGVTVSEWIALRELYRVGPCSPRMLAIELGMTEGAMSRLVERLEAKHMLERSRVPRGKRQWQLSLTSVGRALVPSLEQLARDNDAEFLGSLSSAEREQLTTVLRRVARRHRLKPIPLD
jgi:DNA-binding MarR family transcriptional regulator